MNLKNCLCLFVLIVFFVKCASLKKEESKEILRLPPPNIITKPPPLSNINTSGRLQVQELSMGNLLSWTAFEENVQHYEVEKSGYRTNFKSIGKVEVTTGDDAEKTYHIFDTELGVKNSDYRLKVVETDGTSSFPQVIWMNKRKSNQFSVIAYSSVLANKQFDVTIYSLKEGQLEYSLLNEKGVQVDERYQYIYPKVNEVNVNLEDLPEGTYQVKLKFTEEEEEEFLVIQKTSDSKLDSMNTISEGHYSAFSPNGDGNNDALIIYDLESFQNTEVIIFNQQGKAVFQTANYKNEKAWNGNLLPAGLYYCVINRGNKKELTNTYIRIEK